MTILKKTPYWLNKDTGVNIYLSIDKIIIGSSHNPKDLKLICWARGRYQPVKSNGYRGYNTVSLWHALHHTFHVQPLALYDLNKILKNNHQQTFNKLLLKKYFQKILTINYPLDFQANVIKSSRYGHIFTFDNEPIKRFKDNSDFQKSLPDPGTHPRNHHGPQNDIEL